MVSVADAARQDALGIPSIPVRIRVSYTGPTGEIAGYDDLDVVLDPTDIRALIYEHLPDVLNPEAKLDADGRGLRQTLKLGARALNKTVVRGFAERLSYPVLEVSKHDDYLLASLDYWLGLGVRLAAALGGVVVVIHGERIESIAFGYDAHNG